MRKKASQSNRLQVKKKSVLTDDGMFSLEGARRTLQLCSVKARKRQLWEDRCSTDCHFQR